MQYLYTWLHLHISIPYLLYTHVYMFVTYFCFMLLYCIDTDWLDNELQILVRSAMQDDLENQVHVT